jgi:hypothetical protein
MPPRTKTTLSVLMGLLLTASTCNPNPDRQQRAQTRELLAESNRQIGMPGVTNFTEKRLLRQLYELRDQQDLATFTYVVDYLGRLWHVCDSIGYGMPFSAQFSNPERTVRGGRTLPQPEPNGLWPPTATSATWVICASPDGAFEPVYVEPGITVSPFPLAAHGSWTTGAVAAPD